VPVIAYAVGGLAELIPRQFTPAYGDEAALGSALTSVLQDAGRWPAREVAARAAAWCQPENTAERVSTLLGSTERSGSRKTSLGPHP
jgi:hypothetical protein